MGRYGLTINIIYGPFSRSTFITFYFTGEREPCVFLLFISRLLSFYFILHGPLYYISIYLHWLGLVV